jgi:hypothetical protein
MNSKQKLLSILALSATIVTATLLHAQPNGNEPDQNQLAGTWLGAATPGVAPVLVTYTSEGRTILTRPITVLTGPTSYDTVSTGHGEWVRTANHEFAATTYLLSSNSSTEFSVLIKLTHTIKLNSAGNEITMTGTVAGFDPAGNPLFSFPVNQTFKRVVAGQ